MLTTNDVTTPAHLPLWNSDGDRDKTALVDRIGDAAWQRPASARTTAPSRSTRVSITTAPEPADTEPALIDSRFAVRR